MQKIKWFLFFVIPNVLDRLTAAFFGKLIIQEKNYWGGYLNYLYQYFKILSYFLYAFIISLGVILYFIKTKRYLEIIILTCFVPMSYYCFLILREYGYLTYYAIPILSLLLLYIILSIFEFVSSKFIRIPINRKEKYFYWLISLLVIIMAIQNNIYIRQFWVETNKEGYHFLKNSLSLQIKEKNRIHIFGVLNPGQGNIYSVFATKLALKELGYNPQNFIITVSDNDKLISIIQDDMLKEMKKNITQEELNFLLLFYQHDTKYSRYIYNAGRIDIEKSNILKSIFIKSSFLPGSYENSAVVDLRWISPIWQH